LPVIFRLSPVHWKDLAWLLVRGIAFVVLSGILFPILGLYIFVFGGMAIILVTGGSMRLSLAPPTWIDWARGDLIWLITAAIVGAAVGVLFLAFRILGDASHPPCPGDQPSARTDILGATLAAFLAGVGMLVSTSMDLFSRSVPVTGDWMNPLAYIPRLPTLVSIGTIALLPHLLLIALNRRHQERY
jgi:hypothetical protein